ncbi:PQQ-dependent sugar dehydrogenase, partial [Puniceicoccaceae bacterium K14]|nr:PQQ-dependent sugar dehydrogenase [Puniceicoccaceae bacterium K14]
MQEISFNTAASFDSDDYGNLYICIGDAQTTIHGFPELTHRLDSVLGSILRIDPLGTDSANGQYGIPTDNPWADDGDDNTLGEIFAYGFRNPHRISWDSSDETFMLSGEIGERSIEEINLIEPGNDYGWNDREGTFVINSDWANNPNSENDEVFELPANDADFGYTYPVVQLGRNEARAIIGGYIYRGAAIPALQGKYIFGDLQDGGKIFYVDADS